MDFEDEQSGRLIFNVGMTEINTEAGKFTINIRYPVTYEDNQIYEPMEPVLTRYDIGLVKLNSKAPLYIDENDPLITTLLEIYKKHTGDEGAEPLVTGGGTYARATGGIVAYGALFPGDEDVMHQKDEYIEIEKLELMTKSMRKLFTNCHRKTIMVNVNMQSVSGRGEIPHRRYSPRAKKIRFFSLIR